MSASDSVVPDVYMHVCNGGYSFRVEDQGFGPTLVIAHTFYGHVTMTQIHTDVSSLIELVDMLNAAIRHKNYSEDYCDKATVEEPVEIPSLVEDNAKKKSGVPPSG